MKPIGPSPASGPLDAASGEHPGHLPRLPREYYQGDAMVHWTLPILDRHQGWLTDAFHEPSCQSSAFRRPVGRYPRLHRLKAELWQVHCR